MRLGTPSVLALTAVLLAACTGTPVTAPVDNAAREAEAVAAVERGDMAAARDLYARLVERSQAPRAIRDDGRKL